MRISDWSSDVCSSDLSACQVQHGPGQTTWRTSSEGLEQELSVFVPTTAPVKLVRLRLRNLTPGPRRLTATYYAEWLLGAVHGEQAPLRTSDYDPACHAILARNPWRSEEHTSELQSLMRISYAVFCLK